MTKNIVFFDIDGTLLNERTHIIPESTKIAIKKMRENGHLAFINTGRPISEISDDIRELGFDGYLCGCGTYIEYNNEVLFYKGLGTDLTKEVAKDLNKYKLEGFLEGRYGIYYDYIDNIKNDLVLYIMKMHQLAGFYTNATWHDDNINADKLIVFVEDSSNFDGFYEKYKDTFDFIERDKNFYEVVPTGFSKATCIEYIINKLNIPFENTFAIGDSTNDLSMLEYAHTSIAMGNSNPKLFEIATYITKHVDEDGIYHALNHFGMI